MEEFLVEIATPHWWLSVVAVGLLINLISDPIKGVLRRVTPRLLRERYRSAVERQASGCTGDLEFIDLQGDRGLFETVLVSAGFGAVCFLGLAAMISAVGGSPEVHSPEIALALITASDVGLTVCRILMAVAVATGAIVSHLYLVIARAKSLRSGSP